MSNPVVEPKKPGLALHWKIVIGMGSGILVGILAVYLDSLSPESEDPDLILVRTNRSHVIDLGKRVKGPIEAIRLEVTPGHGEVEVDADPVRSYDPAAGKVEFSPSGILTYRPTSAFVGNDSFSIAYRSGDSGSWQRMDFKIRVGPKPFTWSGLVTDWIKPLGTIFINLLKLIAIPLIVASLIKGISDLNDISNLSALGGRTVLLYLMTTIISVTIGLVVVNVVQPGKGFSEETRDALTADYSGDASQRIFAADQQKDSAPLQALVDVVPDNILGAAGSNSNMLKVIFFVLFFGVGLLLIDPAAAQPIKVFFHGLNDVVLKMIDLIMMLAPVGVFALLAAQVVATPSVDVLLGLIKYSLCVIAGLGTMIFVFYPTLVRIFGGRTYREFFQGISPAQLLAFSTSSSAATLPVTMDCVEDNLGVRKEVASFVLPIGATVNMDGTSLYQAVAAVFIAQALGVELSLSDQLVIVMTATLASIGSAAVPGAGIVMLVIVLGSIGVSEKGIALIFAVDRILDMCRTAVNVTGDATVSILVNRAQEKKLANG